MEMALSVKNQSVETSGITKDYKEAFKWYKKAAELGHEEARERSIRQAQDRMKTQGR